jgi:fatty-acyl-CoA synthase
MEQILTQTVGELLRKQAAERGGSEFLVFPNQGIRYTFSDIARRTSAIAKGLLAMGFTKGEHIGIWAYNVHEWAPVFYAAARVGIVAVPINVNYKHRELDFVLGHADLKGLFIIDQFRDTNFVDIMNDLVPELKTSGAGNLYSVQYPCLQKVVTFDAAAHPGICTLEEVIQVGSRIDDITLEKAEAEVNNKDILCIMYTSGTTGVPKGAMLTHRNIVNNGYFANRLKVIDEHAVILNPLPFFYITALAGCLVESLVYGYKVVALEGFDVLRCLEVIQREGCSWVFGVPTMYIAMLNHPRFNEFNMASVEYACIGGAVCPPELLKAIMGKMNLKGLYLAYGLTETSPFITDVVIEDTSDERLTTVGDPIPGVEVSIRVPGGSAKVPEGEQGEICTRGHNVMQGYYKMEKATREAIDAEGWMHTGDLGHLLSNGCLVIDGRIKELIIRGGEKVFPKEVEKLLLDMPGVKDVQVVGIPSHKYGEEVGAFIMLKENVSISEQEVMEFCREKISFYKIPRYVFFVDSFPLSGNGKIQKFKLSEMGLKKLEEKRLAT